MIIFYNFNDSCPTMSSIHAKTSFIFKKILLADFIEYSVKSTLEKNREKAFVLRN